MRIPQMSKKPPEKPEHVEHYERDLVWASPGGRDIRVDVSRPEGEGPFPMLVWFHGGAWKQGRKENSEGQARYITNRGYAVVNANSRLLNYWKPPTKQTYDRIIQFLGKYLK